MTKAKHWKREGFHTVTPRLIFKSVRKAIKFYSDVFGAKELGLFTGPDGNSVLHGEMQIGDSIIWMVDEMPQMGSHAPETTGQSGVSLMIYVEDADAQFEKAVAAGCTVKCPISDMFWGDRYGMVQDPFGYGWEIGTHKEDLSPDELKKRGEEAFKQMAGSNK